MKKATPAKSVRLNRDQKLYLALIRQLPLRPIRNDADLDRAIEMVNSLVDRPSLNAAEEDYLDVLSDLVERYESQEYPMQPLSDVDMLRHLLEAKEVSQTDVAHATGIAESTISAVLAGKRGLNRHHIGLIARYFNVRPAVFVFE